MDFIYNYAMKLPSCLGCNFYHRVRREEGNAFADHRLLLLQIRE